MASKKRKVSNWQRQAWLIEYQTCQQHNDTIGSQVWVSTTIFLTINVTLLGGLFYTLITKMILEHPNLTKINVAIPILAILGLTILGAGIIWILIKWIDWLQRMRFRTAINCEREGEIEQLLGMRRHTKCHELDQANDSIKNSEDKAAFEKKTEDFKYFRAGGFDGLICIAKILVAIWSISIIISWVVVSISLFDC